MQESVDLGPELAEIELTVQKACGIFLILKDGDTPVPWDWHWGVTVVAVGGSGRTMGSGGDPRGHRIMISEPGIYHLSFGNIEGFEPVPAREARVEAGSFTEIQIELKRKD